MNSLQRLQAESKQLADRLFKQLAIRKAYNIPKGGTLMYKVIKPSGVLMSDTKRHIVKIYVDDALVATDTPANFNRFLVWT